MTWLVWEREREKKKISSTLVIVTIWTAWRREREGLRKCVCEGVREREREWLRKTKLDIKRERDWESGIESFWLRWIVATRVTWQTRLHAVGPLSTIFKKKNIFPENCQKMAKIFTTSLVGFFGLAVILLVLVAVDVKAGVVDNAEEGRTLVFLSTIILFRLLS